MYLKIRFVIWYIYFLSSRKHKKPMLWRKKIKYVIIFCNPWSICMQGRTFIFPSRNPSTAFIACFLPSSSPFKMQKKHEKKVFDLQSILLFLHALDMSKTLSPRGTHVNTASQRTSFEQTFICKEWNSTKR